MPNAKRYFALAIAVATYGVATAHADFHTVTFTNPPGVPTGHLPDSGGRLVATSHNFVEDGVHVESFWAPATLTGFSTAHFHHLENGYETSHGFRGDRQGFYLEMEDGGTFDLISLDYRLLTPLANTSILVTREFDATQSPLGQFTSFPITRQSTFNTLQIDGFDNLTHVFISSILSANQLERVLFDNFVIATHAAVVPIPGAAVLGAVGLTMVGYVRRKRTSASNL